MRQVPEYLFLINYVLRIKYQLQEVSSIYYLTLSSILHDNKINKFSFIILDISCLVLELLY